MKRRSLLVWGLVFGVGVGTGEGARDVLPSVAPVVREAERAVVNIATTAHPEEDDEGDPTTMQELLQRFVDDAPRAGRSLGSGFLISDDGEVLTNQHVIAGATRLRVRLGEDEEYDAQVIGGDDRTDIALLRISAGQRLPALKFGDSDRLAIGDWVVALGNPAGAARTANVGIVSAKGRLLGAGPSDDFIQTDATIGAASSGGPLIDLEGRVVGVNAALPAARGGGGGGGVAVSTKAATWVIAQLREHGRVIRGSIGVSIQPVTPELAHSFGLERAEGALVADITEGGPAFRAGIRRGDIIVRFGDHPIVRARELPVLIAGAPLGSTMGLEYLRDGAPATVEVVIGEAMGEVPSGTQSRAYDGDELTEWGLVMRVVPDGDHSHPGGKGGGLVVEEVDEASPAEEAGIEAGDVIVQANRQVVRTLEDLKRALALRRDHALLLLRRGTASIYAELER